VFFHFAFYPKSEVKMRRQITERLILQEVMNRDGHLTRRIHLASERRGTPIPQTDEADDLSALVCCQRRVWLLGLIILELSGQAGYRTNVLGPPAPE